MRAARAFLRAPVLRCRAPRLTALSMVRAARGARRRPPRRRPPATAASRRRKYVLILRRVAAVLHALALRAQDPLLLRVNVGHRQRIAAVGAAAGRTIARSWPAGPRRRRSRRSGRTGDPAARPHRAQHRDLLHRHGPLAHRGAGPRDRRLELLRHHAAPSRRSRSPSRSPTWCAASSPTPRSRRAFVPVFTELLEQRPQAARPSARARRCSSDPRSRSARSPRSSSSRAG